MSKILKFVGNFLFYGFIVVCVCVSLTMFQAMRQGVQPSILGYKVFVVLTGSMSPTLEVGDLVIVEDTEPEAIAVGDVITYSVGNDNVVTHRVKEVIDDNQIQFVTQGDANNVEDMNPVSHEDLIGKEVYQFVGMGSKIQFIQDNILIIVGLFVAIMTSGYFFVSQLKKVIKTAG